MTKLIQSVSFDALRKGYECTVSNAYSLVTSAMTLMEQFPHVALGLAQLGQEELGKSFAILAAIGLRDDDEDWRSFWNDWKNHEVKAYRAFFYEVFNPMRLQLETPEGLKFGGLARRGSMRAEKEASFYVNFDSATGTFVLPDDDVKQEEVFNRAVTACYLVTTAYAIYQALEEEDIEFRYRALAELALRTCRELLSPPQMAPILAELGEKSSRHKELVAALNEQFAQGKAFFVDAIDKAHRGQQSVKPTGDSDAHDATRCDNSD